MSVCLVLIVKNESAVLPRLITSVRDHIDTWTIVDTGSTDDTADIIERELAGISGTLHHRDWVDFGHNRAEALQLATDTADWLLLADADFEYTIEPGALTNLPSADVFMLDVLEGSMRYAYTGILRSGPEWTYSGRTHETLDYMGYPTARATGITITHHHDGGSRADKFTRDLALLDGLTDPRSTFYRAQTLACLGRADEAADTYLERAAMGGWDEEVYYSLYRAGVLRDDVTLLLAAYSYRPSRLEALYEAAHRLRAQGAHTAVYDLLDAAVDRHTGITTDLLFVEPYVYQYGIAFEYAIAAHNTDRHDLATDTYTSLLQLDDLPAAYRSACETNMALTGPTQITKVR